MPENYRQHDFTVVTGVLGDQRSGRKPKEREQHYPFHARAACRTRPSGERLICGLYGKNACREDGPPPLCELRHARYRDKAAPKRSDGGLMVSPMIRPRTISVRA